MREILPWQNSLALSLLSLGLNCAAQAQYPLRARPVLVRYELINVPETRSGEIAPGRGNDIQSDVGEDGQDKSSKVPASQPARPEEHPKERAGHSHPSPSVQADFLRM